MRDGMNRGDAETLGEGKGSLVSVPIYSVTPQQYIWHLTFFGCTKQQCTPSGYSNLNGRSGLTLLGASGAHSGTATTQRVDIGSLHGAAGAVQHDCRGLFYAALRNL